MEVKAARQVILKREILKAEPRAQRKTQEGTTDEPTDASVDTGAPSEAAKNVQDLRK